MNQVTVSGRLTQAPELKVLKEAVLVSAPIAINEHFKSKKNGEMKQETTFVDVRLWGPAAHEIAKLPKGQEVHIEGKLREDKWQDKETGQNRSKVYVQAFVLQALEKVQREALAPEMER
jgi:single-strand DNA-binding protein